MRNSRILSQHGNVIAADFRPKASLNISVDIKTEVVHRDEDVVLIKAAFFIGGKPFLPTQHYLFSLATGEHVTL